jgi:hypothetical protein
MTSAARVQGLDPLVIRTAEELDERPEMVTRGTDKGEGKALSCRRQDKLQQGGSTFDRDSSQWRNDVMAREQHQHGAWNWLLGGWISVCAVRVADVFRQDSIRKGARIGQSTTASNIGIIRGRDEHCKRRKGRRRAIDKEGRVEIGQRNVETIAIERAVLKITGANCCRVVQPEEKEKERRRVRVNWNVHF